MPTLETLCFPVLKGTLLFKPTPRSGSKRRLQDRIIMEWDFKGLSVQITMVWSLELEIQKDKGKGHQPGHARHKEQDRPLLGQSQAEPCSSHRCWPLQACQQEMVSKRGLMRWKGAFTVSPRPGTKQYSSMTREADPSLISWQEEDQLN